MIVNLNKIAVALYVFRITKAELSCSRGLPFAVTSQPSAKTARALVCGVLPSKFSSLATSPIISSQSRHPFRMLGSPAYSQKSPTNQNRRLLSHWHRLLLRAPRVGIALHLWRVASSRRTRESLLLR